MDAKHVLAAPLRTALILSAALSLSLLAGCQQRDGSSPAQGFATPEAAVEALLTGLENNDQAALLDLLGDEHRDQLITADWEADVETRATIAREGRATNRLDEIDASTRQLVIGSEEWPFPMPIVQAGDEWRFDTAAGVQELVDRRVGRNELAALGIMQAYVDAQIEYATADRDDDGLLEYAQKLSSSKGKQDGLYWESKAGEPESPFGPLVAKSKRYLDTREPGEPIRGYYYEVLTAQSDAPSSGARDYIVAGNMLTGFALIAYPAEYGQSGVMSFIVSHRGDIFEKDLGDIEGMELYDPDDSWVLVEE